MDFYRNGTLWSFLHEKDNTMHHHSPPRLSCHAHTPTNDHHHHQLPSELAESPLAHVLLRAPSSSPPSPDSPWMLTPRHPSPSPTLLYHCVASLHRHEGNILSIAALKGIVFTGSESCRIRVWRPPECIERGHLKTTSGDVRGILAYGNLLFTAHKDCKVRIWSMCFTDNFRAKKISTLPRRRSFLSILPRGCKHDQHKDCISCLAYYHAEGLVYTASWDKTVKTWRVSDQRCVDSFVAHEDVINAVVVSQEDGCLFTSSSDGAVKIWRRVYGENSHSLTMTLKFQPSPVNALALSSNMTSCYLYSGSSDGIINFWEKEKGSGRFNHGGFLQGHRFSVLCLVALEGLVISGSEDTTIRVWKKEEGGGFHACLAVLDGHRGPVRCLAACLEMEKIVMGFLVYSASLDGTFKVWRVKVFPGEKSSKEIEDNDNINVVTMRSDSHGKAMEYEMSPVLSPSWVEKKRQGEQLL